MKKIKFYAQQLDPQPGCRHGYFSCTCPYKPVLVDGYDIDGTWGVYQCGEYHKSWILIHFASGLSNGKTYKKRKEVVEHLKEIKEKSLFEKHVEENKEWHQRELDEFNQMLTEMGVQQYRRS